MTEQLKPQWKGNYAHWSGKPVTPGIHTPAYVPQSIADCWQVHCSCGEWAASRSFYDINNKADLLKALESDFNQHVNKVSQ